MSYDWYARYIRRWRGGTRHMTLTQKGAYSELIDEYMDSGEPLPDNDLALAVICGCTIDEWSTVSTAVRAKFEQSNGKLVHEVCENELYARSMRGASRTKQAKSAAQKRWKTHKLNANSNADAMLTAMRNDATLQKSNLSDLPSSEPSREPQPMIINGINVQPTPELVALVERQNRERGIEPPASIASALPSGALTRPANADAAKPNGKAPHVATREEMEAIFAARRQPNPTLSPSDDELKEIPFD